jgi:hypothetical protein
VLREGLWGGAVFSSRDRTIKEGSYLHSHSLFAALNVTKLQLGAAKESREGEYEKT